MKVRIRHERTEECYLDVEIPEEEEEGRKELKRILREEGPHIIQWNSSTEYETDSVFRLTNDGKDEEDLSHIYQI